MAKKLDGPKKAEGSATKQRVFRFRDDEYERWQQIAFKQGMTLTAWLRAAAEAFEKRRC